ncbi:MAG: MobF family relaxase, partial [Pseudomonadota bacterium]
MVGGASAAANYYNADDYYARDDLAPSMWFGRGAQTVDLQGIVDKDTFQSVLEGFVPGTTERVGFESKGEWVHRGGFDATFSAPKSVSVLAEVGGDTRLIHAHDRAVEVALGKIEAELIQYRIKEQGAHRFVKSDNMIAAVYRHDLSRDLDPQLHSHAVIANMTLTDQGWRSISNELLFRHSKEVGVVYQQALALEVRRLGYEVERQAKGTFEIPGAASAAAQAFQQRTDAIDDYLRAKGIDPALATAEMRQTAVLATRKSKQNIDRETVHETWIDRIGEHGLDALDRQQDQARARALQGSAAISDEELDTSADMVVATAVAMLSEHAARISNEAVLREANELAIGRTSESHVAQALERLKDKRGIYAVTVREPDRTTRVDEVKQGLTTKEAQILEGKMIAGMRRMQRGETPLTDHRSASLAVANAMRAAGEHGHSWTVDQRHATIGLLRETDRVAGLQGLPGTAKTTTVLKTVAGVAEDKGMKVFALAPTASAAKTLGESLGLNGRTVTAHLNAAERNAPGMASPGRALWVVDEASMVGTKDMGRLLKEADRRSARVLLVGDTGQLSSVPAGAAFQQLQERGLATYTLHTIVRQTNLGMRWVANAAATHQGRDAIEVLDGAGKVVEDRSVEARISTVASTYTALT